MSCYWLQIYNIIIWSTEQSRKYYIYITNTNKQHYKLVITTNSEGKHICVIPKNSGSYFWTLVKQQERRVVCNCTVSSITLTMLGCC